MGRSNFHQLDDGDPKPKFIVHVCPLDDGGYDEGGAYWGARKDEHHVWRAVATEAEVEFFFDSTTRKEAIRHVKGLYPSAEILDTPFARFLEEFVLAYIEAAHFTEDEQLGDDAGSLQLAADAESVIREECEKFATENEALLRSACANGKYTASQAGQDFWLNRNGHGSGFWDRDELPDDISEALSDASRAAGERSLYIDDAGTLSYS